MERCLLILLLEAIAMAAWCSETTHFAFDGRTGMREESGVQELRYDVSWEDGGATAKVYDGDTLIADGVQGVYSWQPTTCRHELSLKIYDLLENLLLTENALFSSNLHTPYISEPASEPTNGRAGSTAEITCTRCGEVLQAAEEIPALGYIRDLKVRQLWPHKAVGLVFRVEDDVGEVATDSTKIQIKCQIGNMIYTATNLCGDVSATAGRHNVVWDMEKQGVNINSDSVNFLLAVNEVVIASEDEEVEEEKEGEEDLGGVQLWENGPYWAECNVGASKPEEYGYYFWWGDTVGYKRNASDNGWVSVADGSSFQFSKCPAYGMNNSSLQSAGYIDETGNLTAAHDAATAHLGGSWRMPTDAEYSALINNCTTTWTTRNGVSGRLITGKGAYASKSIFLPAAGLGSGSYLYSTGSDGLCWSSTPSSDSSFCAWFLSFLSGNFSRDLRSRFGGQSVRPVRGFAK